MLFNGRVSVFLFRQWACECFSLLINAVGVFSWVFDGSGNIFLSFTNIYVKKLFVNDLFGRIVKCLIKFSYYI